MPYKQALQADNYELTNVLAKVIKRKNPSSSAPTTLALANITLYDQYPQTELGFPVSVIAPNSSEITNYNFSGWGGYPNPLDIQAPLNSLIIIGPCNSYEGHRLSSYTGAEQLFIYIDSEADDSWTGAMEDTSLYSIFKITDRSAILQFNQAYKEGQGDDDL